VLLNFSLEIWVESCFRNKRFFWSRKCHENFAEHNEISEMADENEENINLILKAYSRRH